MGGLVSRVGFILSKAGLESPEINFTLVGKHSTAHKIAIEVFRGKRKPDMIVKSDDVLKLVYA